MTRTRTIVSSLMLAVWTAAAALPAAGQLPEDLSVLSDAGLYRAACANCHGADGTGVSPTLLAFEEEVPDFTDCDFAARVTRPISNQGAGAVTVAVVGARQVVG